MIKIKVADLVIKVNNRYNTVVEKCRDYLVADDTPEDFFIEITDEEIAHVKKETKALFFVLTPKKTRRFFVVK